jgi:integrase
MSVRRRTRRDPSTGAVREVWMIDVDFEHARGRRERIRKVSPVQTKRGAEEYERQVRAELLDPTPTPKTYPTLEAFVRDRWMPNDAKATNRHATIREKENQLRVHILPQLGKLRLNEITAEKVASFYASLAEKDLSVKTRKNYGGTLHRILACAVEWDVLDRIPKFPRLKAPDAKWDFYTRDETDSLLACVEDPYERALLVFAFHTGARSGEQIAIEWGDIDWHNRFVVFRRAASRGIVGPTKDSDERKVPMTPLLEASLKAIRHLKGDLVFSEPDGTPLNPWKLARALNRASRRAGLRRIRRHDTRHSFASQLVMANVPLVQVQAWMGHSTIAMTMKYAHLAPSPGHELIRALDSSSPSNDYGTLAAPA